MAVARPNLFDGAYLIEIACPHERKFQYPRPINIADSKKVKPLSAMPKKDNPIANKNRQGNTTKFAPFISSKRPEMGLEKITTME